MTYLIGCLHLGHESMAKHRGFSDSWEHDEWLIKCWNNIVGKRDKVFILGDITMETSKYYYKLDELNGYKQVILGNHDRPQDVNELLKYVNKVSGVVDYKDYILTHVPIHPNEVHFYKANIHCVDKDTEILTKSGWKYYNELVLGEDIYSISNEGKLVDDTINTIIINPQYKGKIVEVKDRSTHLIYTDEHKVPYRTRFGNPLRWMLARDMLSKGNTVLLSNGIHENQEGLDISDDILRLLICLAADGNITKYNSCRLNVTKERKHIYFKNILNRLSIDYTTSSNKSFDYCLGFQLPKGLYEYNIKGLDSKLLGCNRHQCGIILEAYSHTDGYVNGNAIHIYTSKKSEFDILTHVMTINGYRCATYDRLGGFTNSGINYCIAVLDKQEVIKTNLRDIVSIRDSRGELFWCITCNNGNFISRRNGETYVTGNCHIHHVNKLEECTVHTSYQDRDSIIYNTLHKYINVDAKLLDFKPISIDEINNRYYE